MQTQNQDSKGKALLAAIIDSSFITTFVASCFVFLIRFVSFFFKLVFKTSANELPVRTSYMAPASTTSRASVDLAEFTVNEAKSRTDDFKDTVVAPVQKADFEIATRVHVANLEVAHGVQVGRLWFYIYDKKVRRVFKVEDRQIQAILGDTQRPRSRYYMEDLPWDSKSGEEGIKALERTTVEEVCKLVYERANRRAGTKTNKQAKEAKALPQALKIAPALASVKSEDIKPQVAQATSTSEAPAEVKKSVARPVEGRTHEGVIAEMGRTMRPGRDGNYEAYCLKLELNGVHTPLYGVELERELLERKAQAGDLVRVIDMGRQPVQLAEGRTGFKNLYRVVILKKGETQ